MRFFSAPLPLLLLASTLVSTTDASASIYQCDVNEPCEETFDTSCTEVIRAYSLTGECCSLADTEDGTGCTLRVSGPTATEDTPVTCIYDERECPSCCTKDDDGGVACVAPAQITVFSPYDTNQCPASTYIASRTVVPLKPFNISVIDDGTTPGDELSTTIEASLESYLEAALSDEYPDTIVALRAPSVWDEIYRSRTRRSLQDSESSAVIFEYLGDALLPTSEDDNADGMADVEVSIDDTEIAALQNTAALQDAIGLEVTGVDIEGVETAPNDADDGATADTTATVGSSQTVESNSSAGMITTEYKVVRILTLASVCFFSHFSFNMNIVG